MAVQRVVLENHSDIAVFGRHFGNVLTVDDEVTAGDILKAGNHTKGCGLSAARRADENDKLAVFNVQVKIENSLYLIVINFFEML